MSSHLQNFNKAHHISLTNQKKNLHTKKVRQPLGLTHSLIKSIFYYFTTRFFISHVADSASLQRYLKAKRALAAQNSAGTTIWPEGT